MNHCAKLLTFAPMIDSECCRLILRYHRVSHDEEPHIFGWASALALWRRGTVVIPLVSGLGKPIAGPLALAERLDETCPPATLLRPGAEPIRQRIDEDWRRYNQELGTAVAAFAYFHLLPRRELMEETVTRGVPGPEARHGRSTYPAFRWVLTKLLGLDAPSAADARLRIRAAFDLTDARVADGRRFLIGDHMTLGDLALASSLAPLLQPRGHAAPVPPIALMPSELRDFIGELAPRPTASFVQGIYDTVARPCSDPTAAAPIDAANRDGLASPFAKGGREAGTNQPNPIKPQTLARDAD